MADAPPPAQVEEVPLDIPVLENLENDTRERLKMIRSADMQYRCCLDEFIYKRDSASHNILPMGPERAKHMTLPQAKLFRDLLRAYCDVVLDPAIEAREADVAKAERSLAALATAKKRAEAEIYEEAAAHFAGAAKKQKKEAEAKAPA